MLTKTWSNVRSDRVGQEEMDDGSRYSVQREGAVQTVYHAVLQTPTLLGEPATTLALPRMRGFGLYANDDRELHVGRLRGVAQGGREVMAEHGMGGLG